jgi:hypothetical protein
MTNNVRRNTVKKILSICCAVILSAPLLVSAADLKTDAGKNPCILNSENCSGQIYSIQETITQLQNEVQKGTSVYSAGELSQLKAKLAEYQSFMTLMISNP